MFQFPGFAPLYRAVTRSPAPGCPIRRSADQGIFAPPRGLSQLITSFVASESLGILHVPFSPFFMTLVSIGSNITADGSLSGEESLPCGCARLSFDCLIDSCLLVVFCIKTCSISYFRYLRFQYVNVLSFMSSPWQS